MEKAKKILDWIWIIVKIIFAIALVIVGIKLILWLVFPLFSLWFIPSPFSSFDWNPLTTLFGAIITGGITWYAVYKTAEFDKDARIYEFRYKHYIDTLDVLSEELKTIYKLTYYFEKDEDCIMSKTIDDAFSASEYNIRKFRKTYTHLCNINARFAEKMKGFDSILEEFINIYCFTVRQLVEHRWYLQSGEEKYKKDFITELNEKRLIYCVDDLLAYYKNEKDIEYDVNQMNDSIEKLRNIIEEEFKLDNRKK